MAQPDKHEHFLLQLPPAPGVHASDCSQHNMPAYPNKQCDCGVEW